MEVNLEFRESREPAFKLVPSFPVRTEGRACQPSTSSLARLHHCHRAVVGDRKFPSDVSEMGRD